ncbi:hypothetical protein TNCV_2754451 [Trichonephila clavipes]|nr:hypothetical protein TNCV_2754451 [Trichonephila clavipes]
MRQGSAETRGTLNSDRRLSSLWAGAPREAEAVVGQEDVHSEGDGSRSSQRVGKGYGCRPELVRTHVQSDTMASAVLADLTRALQGTNRGSGPAMEESENDVGSLEQLMLYADKIILLENCPWETI